MNQVNSRSGRHRASSRRAVSQQMQPHTAHTFGPNTAPNIGNPPQEARIESFSSQMHIANYSIQQEVDNDDRANSIVAPADATKVNNCKVECYLFACLLSGTITNG